MSENMNDNDKRQTYCMRPWNWYHSNIIIEYWRRSIDNMIIDMIDKAIIDEIYNYHEWMLSIAPTR